jgi:hypothetical protein
MTPTFTGTVKDGKLFIDKNKLFRQHLLNYPTGKRVEVTVEKLSRTRTNNQNRYYWGVIIKEIAQHTGHDPEQVHEYLKFRFSPKMHFNLPIRATPEQEFLTTPSQPMNEGIPTSTTRLDTLAFVEYTEKCRLWANEYLGLQIPLPGEVEA